MTDEDAVHGRRPARGVRERPHDEAEALRREEQAAPRRPFPPVRPRRQLECRPRRVHHRSAGESPRKVLTIPLCKNIFLKPRHIFLLGTVRLLIDVVLF